MTASEPVNSNIAAAAKPVALQKAVKSRSLWSDAWRQFRRHRMAMVASVVLAVIVAMVLVGPYVWTIDPTQVNIVDSYSNGSPAHPFGTDNLGRDTLARVMQGGRISLAIGVSAMAISITLGALVGLLSGYFARLDGLLMRLTDMFLSLPLLPLLLVITMLFRDPLRKTFGTEAGIFILTVTIIGALNWMTTARLVRGEVLAIKEREFVLAARSVGTSDLGIIRRHILPNVMSPVIVAATFSIASAIITESALSFLGLGFPPDFPTWGRLLFDGKDFMTLIPALAIWPGTMISLTILCVNFIGDGLRDALDPRLRE
ncbi:MAG: ABC transporter permease [Chloroflexi bacterium]|nr:ABC transporter permease [Chloroflexota bacterium]